jgi:uncharacterized damage-inducible protein DinB
MRWSQPYTLTLALLAGAVSSGAAFAAEPDPLIRDYLTEMDRVREQLVTLADAMPQEIYTWRPAEGVRSVSEVYLHIAFANYLLPHFAGYAPPADLAAEIDVAKIQAWDTSTTDKAAIASRVSSSFDHLRSIVAAVPTADLDATVEFFGETATKRRMLILALGHLHEHLGQAIAYARMNGVVPPWTAAQQAAAEQSAEKAGDGY